MSPSTSLFDGLVARPRDPWANRVLIVLLYLVPIAAAYADGTIGSLLQGDLLPMFIAPTVIGYVLLIAPRMAHMDADVLRSFRPVVLLDDQAFDHVVRLEGRTTTGRELVVFAVGALFGLFSAGWGPGAPSSWLPWVWRLSNALMYGLLAATVYAALVATRLITALLRQPLRVDAFDTTPFEPMGRQSLLQALVFVGGITLGLVFSMVQPGMLGRVEFWLVYVGMLLVPLVIFFLGLMPVHRVLAGARDRELRTVQQHLERLCREVGERIDRQQDTGSLAAQITALTHYEQRLQAAATWPYNTGMLRTLVFGVFVPGATVLLKVLLDVLID